MWLILYINKIIGAIFCHDNKINELIQFNPSITSGNQKWKGAAPIFVKSAELKINIIILLFNENGRFIDIEINLNNKIVEARACTIKYLIDASVAIMFFVSFIKGINDNRLISKPIHIPNQEWDEIEIIVLIINVDINNNLYNFVIKKKRIKTFINGV